MQPARRLEVVSNDVIETRVAHLRKVSLFDDLASNEPALREFATLLQEHVFQKGAHIITEGTPSSEMFILISGRAEVFKTTPEGDKFKVSILEGKDHAFFGEGGLIHSEVRSASIISECECQCLILKREDFERLGNSHPEWALPFYRRIAAIVLSRLRKTNGDLMVLYKALVAEIRGH
jgi:CRP-like cAMP-binding protein